MTMSMHSASVPVFVRMLANVATWLDKAEAHAKARNFEPAVYLEARLAPDMLPFPAQIQIACDMAKFCVARLSGAEAPKFADDEKTLADLKARIAKTSEFLRSVSADALDGTDDKSVTIPRRGGTMTMTGEAYLKHWALPNFYFHATTTYALLRQYGVELGKADFLGGPPPGATVA